MPEEQPAKIAPTEIGSLKRIGGLPIATFAALQAALDESASHRDTEHPLAIGRKQT
jgi:hypothetical protein